MIWCQGLRWIVWRQMLHRTIRLLLSETPQKSLLNDNFIVHCLSKLLTDHCETLEKIILQSIQFLMPFFKRGSTHFYKQYHKKNPGAGLLLREKIRGKYFSASAGISSMYSIAIYLLVVFAPVGVFFFRQTPF